MATIFPQSGWEQKKLWETILWKEAQNEIWWKNWMGASANNIIQKKTDLEAQKGYKIAFGLQPRLTSTGLTASGTTKSNELEGNEENMTFYGDSVSIDHWRHAVKNAGKFNTQKQAFDAKVAMKDALKIWVAEKMDGLFFSTMNTSPTHVLTVGGDTTNGVSASNFAATNELLLTHIRKLPYLAKTQRIKPLRIGGRNYFVLLMHDQVAYQLQQKYSTTVQTWYDTMVRAKERGENNPVFSGALGVVGGGGASIILHNHDNANLRADTTSTAACYSLLLGQQAGLYAVAQEPTWTEKLFDYDDKLGVATDFMSGVKKAQFNSDDFGVYSVRSYAATI